MKKVLVVLAVFAVLSFAAMSQASTVSFTWGANFYSFADTELGTGNGTASALQWYVDDFAYGVRVERNTAVTGDEQDDVDVTEVTVDKWINKFVAVGIGLGTLSTTDNSLFDAQISVPVVDVRGTIQLLSGKGDKINASVDFNVAARWANSAGLVDNNFTNNAINNFNGAVATLGVTLGL